VSGTKTPTRDGEVPRGAFCASKEADGIQASVENVPRSGGEEDP